MGLAKFVSNKISGLDGIIVIYLFIYLFIALFDILIPESNTHYRS